MEPLLPIVPGKPFMSINWSATLHSSRSTCSSSSRGRYVPDSTGAPNKVKMLYIALTDLH